MNRYPGKDFPVAAPETQGIPSRAIAHMLEDIQRDNKDIHSMLLWRHGQLVFEQYFAPYTATTAHSMFSCSKTFTSMLTGIAQGKGLLSVEDPVLKYFPDVPVDAPSDNLKAMRVKHLLMMGTGHGEDTFPHMRASEDGDWVKTFLNRPVDYEPGTHFLYNTGATYMLSAILTRVTGKTALELAREWIFQYIGIEDAEWETCPKGISMGGTGMHIRPRDMMRFGILILSGGRWGDRQVVPREYVLEAQSKQISNVNSNMSHQNPNWAAGYCYQMWRCGFDAFRADGMGGQYIVMFPKYDMVAVFTSSLGSDIGYPLDLIEKHLLPAIRPGAVIPSAADAQELEKLSLKAACPKGRATMPKKAADFPFGTTWALPKNDSGITALTPFEDHLELKLKDHREPLSARFLWDAPLVNEPANAPHDRLHASPVALTARWEKNALYLRMNFVGTPFTYHITIAPQEKGKAHIVVRSTMSGQADAVCAPKKA